MDNSTKTNFFRPAIPASDDEKFNPNNKLNELSAEERESGIEELHGVSDVVTEDPTIVHHSLKSIREQLNLSNSAAVDDTELLKFLRAERFDVDKAAIRFNRFAAFQGKLFGKQGKTKFSDLNDEDMKYLQSGFMQLLPQRDRAGRAILICIGSIKQQLKTAVETDVSIGLFQTMCSCHIRHIFSHFHEHYCLPTTVEMPIIPGIQSGGR